MALDTDIKLRRMRHRTRKLYRTYPAPLRWFSKASTLSMLVVVVVLPAITIAAWLAAILAN